LSQNTEFMKKLEDIPKKEIFNVPEGYFEKLPGVIQSRVSADQKSETRFSFQLAVRYALPVLIVGVTAFWFYRSSQQTDSMENMLADIQTADLVAYLEETDLSTDELLESVQLDKMDASEIENEVYDFNLDDADLDAAIEEIDLTDL